MRAIGPKELSHERLGNTFLASLSTYDTSRRVETLVGEFLGNRNIQGLRALDVGCGYGFFSAALKERGAIVTACDIGPGLVRATAERVGCNAVVADVLSLEDCLGGETFDIVLSSECVEHTPSPMDAIAQMARVVRPGGVLVLSTPNYIWQPVVRIASTLKLRPFDGHENFITWGALRTALASEGISVIGEKGLHLFPFQFRMHALSRLLDHNCQWLRWLMINMCIIGRKEAA